MRSTNSKSLTTPQANGALVPDLVCAKTDASAQITPPTLKDLAAAIRAERAELASDFINRAARIGAKLKSAKAMCGHGQWLEFLRCFDLSPRTAQRYVQLADLTAANASWTTHLGPATIERAIKRLSPPKAGSTTKGKPVESIKPKRLADPKQKRTASHIAILEVWLAASPTDRTKAIDSVGLDAILAAMPAAWWSLLDKRLAERNAAPAAIAATDPTSIPADLSIPHFLKRAAVFATAAGALSA